MLDQSCFLTVIDKTFWGREISLRMSKKRCATTTQTMLQNGTASYKRSDIDDFCQRIVAHERNFAEILNRLK